MPSHSSCTQLLLLCGDLLEHVASVSSCFAALVLLDTRYTSSALPTYAVLQVLRLHTPTNAKTYTQWPLAVAFSWFLLVFADRMYT